MLFGWFVIHSCDCVLFLDTYRKTSCMIWQCLIHWEISKDESDDLNMSYSDSDDFYGVLFVWKYQETSLMIWRCPLPWKLAGGTDMWVPCSIYTGSSGGWVTRYIMISDSGWDMTVGERILLVLPLSALTVFHTVLCAQVHIHVLLFCINKQWQTNDFSCSEFRFTDNLSVASLYSLVQSSDTLIISL